ncbi:hypothetical protein [Streptomyces sp. NPDC008121]|uniref:hypothetical protein n=1 Tax=Streptomyces sp. NPDC008121 TaxID=3364809 RepID=UPI0036EAC6C2
MTHKLATFAATVAAVAATGTLGVQAAQAVPATHAAPACAIETKHVITTDEGYALTDIAAIYRTERPESNTTANYELWSEPQNCAGGEFYLLDVLENRVIPMSGKPSVENWRDVGFRLTSEQRFILVMYGDPLNPWDGDFIASVSKLIP